MKRKDFNRLTISQQKAVKELVRDQPDSMLVRSKIQSKGFSDLPMFQEKEKQTSLF